MQIVNVLAGRVKNNIDSLNIPALLKSALKKLKSLFIPQTNDSEEGKTDDPESENAENKSEAKETSETSGNASKEQ